MSRNARMAAFSQWCIQNPRVCLPRDSWGACAAGSCVFTFVLSLLGCYTQRECTASIGWSLPRMPAKGMFSEDKITSGN